MSSLENKSRALQDIVTRLRLEHGDNLALIDHWAADNNALGVARADNHQVLAYISAGEKGLFFVELEMPQTDNTNFPYRVAGTFEDIGVERVCEIVKNHLGQELQALKVVSRDMATPFTTADGSQIRELMHPNFSAARNQSLAEATLAPGQATTEHYHPLAEELYFILRGQGTLRVEGQERAVAPGDTALIVPGARHKIWNTGGEDLVFLCCCAPAYCHEDTVLTE